MTMLDIRSVETQSTNVDLRLAPARPARHQFHAQIARLEQVLAATLADLEPSRRPTAQLDAEVARVPRMLSAAELEASRDALLARVVEAKDLVARQADDRTDARNLLKRMTEAPADFHWATVTTKDIGTEGCRTWQSVPVMGPIGMLGNWWRIRMSSGCP